MKQILSNYLSLFTSFGTLLCCALPSLLVALGAGAVVASAVSTLPWLVFLSYHKGWVFIGAGILIALNFALVYRPRGKVACTVGGGKACEEATRVNKIILWVSACLFLVGAFVAYAALPLVKFFDG
jgi:mercuric ion transport protein